MLRLKIASEYIMSFGEKDTGLYSSVDVKYAVLRLLRAFFHAVSNPETSLGSKSAPVFLM